MAVKKIQVMIVYLYKLVVPMSTYIILIAALAMESGKKPFLKLY